MMKKFHNSMSLKPSVNTERYLKSETL
jgi:hypothetical protein